MLGHLGRCWGTEVGTGHLWARDGQLGCMGGTCGAALGLMGAAGGQGALGRLRADTRTARTDTGTAPSPPSHAQRLLQVCNFTTVPKPGTEVN